MVRKVPKSAKCSNDIIIITYIPVYYLLGHSLINSLTQYKLLVEGIGKLSWGDRRKSRLKFGESPGRQ